MSRRGLEHRLLILEYCSVGFRLLTRRLKPGTLRRPGAPWPARTHEEAPFSCKRNQHHSAPCLKLPFLIAELGLRRLLGLAGLCWSWAVELMGLFVVELRALKVPSDP